MRLAQITTFMLALTLAAVGACASSGPKVPCALAKIDSVYVGLEPVYEACAVDRQAKRLLIRDEGLHYQPARPIGGATGCIFAEARFIIDTLGMPEPGTARLVKTNDQDYADFVLTTFTRLHYEPALLAGKRVRQIHTEHQAIGFYKVVLPAGSSPARAPSEPPRPSGAVPKC